LGSRVVSADAKAGLACHRRRHKATCCLGELPGSAGVKIISTRASPNPPVSPFSRGSPDRWPYVPTTCVGHISQFFPLPTTSRPTFTWLVSARYLHKPNLTLSFCIARRPSSRTLHLPANPAKRLVACETRRRSDRARVVPGKRVSPPSQAEPASDVPAIRHKENWNTFSLRRRFLFANDLVDSDEDRRANLSLSVAIGSLRVRRQQ